MLSQGYRAVCRYVVDGDSLYLQGVKQQIRLWGVDAPERNEKGYGLAKDELKKLALGKMLICVTQDKDKYNRLVAKCFVDDPANDNLFEINKAMIDSHRALEYCRFSDGYYGHCDS